MQENNVPKIGVYTLTHNRDGGIDTFIYYDEGEYDEAFEKLVGQAYKNWFGEDLEGDPQEAYDKLCEQVGFMDTIDQDSEEFEIPWVIDLYKTLQELFPNLAADQQKKVQEILARVPLKT